MRFALNLLYLLPGIVGGTETYAAGLLSGLAAENREDEFFVFLNTESADWPLPQAENFVRVVCPIRASRRDARYYFEQLCLPAMLNRYSIDMVHSLGYVSPLRIRCPAVVTVPDLNFRAFGDQIPYIRRLVLSFFVRQSVLRATRVLTLSEFSRAMILQAYKLSSERVVVTPLAPRTWDGAHADQRGAADSSLQQEVIPPYVVAFSSTTPNKNIPRLLLAFALARVRYGLPHQLLLVGHPPAELRGSSEHRMDQHEAVRFTGYLSESALRRILSGAQLLVFPSVFEGFGMPVLEAMASGVPVVCSNRASLPEVAGDAAVFFDPYSPEDMAQKLARVAIDGDLRADLVTKGYRNLQRFSWRRTAHKTLQVYQEAAAA